MCVSLFPSSWCGVASRVHQDHPAGKAAQALRALQAGQGHWAPRAQLAMSGTRAHSFFVLCCSRHFHHYRAAGPPGNIGAPGNVGVQGPKGVTGGLGTRAPTLQLRTHSTNALQHVGPTGPAGGPGAPGPPGSTLGTGTIDVVAYMTGSVTPFTYTLHAWTKNVFIVIQAAGGGAGSADGVSSTSQVRPHRT